MRGVILKIALLTDLPVLCKETMYIDELRTRLSDLEIETKIFTIFSSSTLRALDEKTGLIRMIKSIMIMKKLFPFDLLHVQFTSPIGFALSFLVRLHLLKIPVIIHTHGYDVFTVPEINYGLRRSRLGRMITMSTWANANRILVVCRRAHSDLTKLGIQNLSLLYNGVDEKRFSKIEDSKIPQSISRLRDVNDVIFLSVASGTPVKNHLRLIKAFEKSTEKYSPKRNLKLLVIGSKFTPVIGLRIPTNVQYIGSKMHQDLPFFYSISDAFILPSLSEAHPWSILEAMSCELPVIGSNIGGIPETLHQDSLLVNPYSIDDISTKINEMVELGPNGRKDVGKKNRNRILQKYTIGQHVQDLVKIYNEVLSR